MRRVLTIRILKISNATSTSKTTCPSLGSRPIPSRVRSQILRTQIRSSSDFENNSSIPAECVHKKSAPSSNPPHLLPVQTWISANGSAISLDKRWQSHMTVKTSWLLPPEPLGHASVSFCTGPLSLQPARSPMEKPRTGATAAFASFCGKASTRITVSSSIDTVVVPLSFRRNCERYTPQ